MAQNNNLHANKKKYIPFMLFMDGGEIIRVINIFENYVEYKKNKLDNLLKNK